MNMTHYCGSARRIPFTNSGSALGDGDIVIRASGTSGVVGMAVGKISATTGTGELEITGVKTATKASGEAFTDGQVLYYDGTQLTGTSSTTFTRVGRSVGAAALAAVTCKVDLNVF